MIMLPYNSRRYEIIIDAYPSDGRYYDNWIAVPDHRIEWFFEKEEDDAIIFSLKWLCNSSKS